MCIRDRATEGRFDYLLIESTGISEPLPVATTFDFRDENGKSLSDVSKLDTMVTVVDAANLINNYSSTDFLRDQGESLGDEDERTLVDLLVEQIEFANIILLNKIDLINDILAAKEMYVGRYYFDRKKWIAAINRFKYVIDDYETTIYVQEALHRLVEIYYILGLESEAKKYANLGVFLSSLIIPIITIITIIYL